MNADELLTTIETAIKTIVKRNIESKSYCFVNVQTVLNVSNLGTSTASFRRLCHETIGKSPLTIIHEIRLNMAKEMLTTSDSIEEIARKCGFSDHGKFTKKFKQFMGVTPSEFREISGEQQTNR